MSRPDYEIRRQNLLRKLTEKDLPALLVSGLANVRYLTGFSGDSSWLLVSPGLTVMLSDTRYETQLADECPGLQLEIRNAGSTILDLTATVVEKAGLKRLGFEADHVTVAQHKQIAEKVKLAALVESSSLVEDLREIKDDWEIGQIRAALRCAELGFSAVRNSLRPQQTETEIRFLLEAAMRSFGGDETGFLPIVGVGPTAALPHAHAGHRRVSESPVLLIDWGAAMPSGYRCDLTRVLITGKPTDEIRKVYEVVLAAQTAAIAAIRPGMPCVDVDRIARQIIEQAGYGEFFGHGLGHGFGLEIHESVRVSPISKQVFAAGMVVTMEPGIYLPGQFGVRIEDDILVTEDGHEVLSTLPREFDAACVNILA